MGRNKDVVKLYWEEGLVLMIGNIEELIALSRHKYSLLSLVNSTRNNKDTQQEIFVSFVLDCGFFNTVVRFSSVIGSRSFWRNRGLEIHNESYLTFFVLQ
jgi:hypothetical protein